uniref:Lipocalin/cytosolic fatty-acid binding domain-containing protein n=1 Tax=Bos indicus x Bos taurus TaxID=30522 RepID=A0A4W2D0S0_BOBOX
LKILVSPCLSLPLAESPSGAHFIDLLQITGEWFSILLASDDREKIENGSMRFFVEYISLLENSSLEQVKGFHFFPTDQRSSEPCSVFSTDDGENKFRILQVNYSQHIIFYLENFSDSFKLLELYAREPDTSPELKNEFVEICQKYGVVKENVIDLTKVDRCLQARRNGVA